MAKEELARVNEAINSDGTLNADAFESVIVHTMAQAREGHYSLHSCDARETDLGNGDVAVSLNYIRHEN